MRNRSFLLVTLLLVFAISQAWGEGLASAELTVAPVSTWADLSQDRSVLSSHDGNNTTAPPSFPELVPIIIFILAGVGIAIVIVAVGLWIAGQRKRGKGEGDGKGQDSEAKVKGEDEEWGASWKD